MTQASTDTPRSEAAPARNVAREFRQNPQPRQGYRITMTIENAPGPFAQVQGLAQYDVVNPDCLPPPDANPGGHTSPVPTEDVEIPLTKVSDNEYVGTVYADRMLDEDYYGRGTCRWKLIQARVHMKATGADGETLFIPSIPDDKLLTEKNMTVYFLSAFYPKAGMQNYVDTGDTDRSKFAKRIRDEDLFAVKFVAEKEVGP